MFFNLIKQKFKVLNFKVYVEYENDISAIHLHITCTNVCALYAVNIALHKHVTCTMD